MTADMGGTLSLSPTPGATVTINIDLSAACTIASWTAGQNETIVISGTPVQGQRLILMITNDGVSPRTINFGTGFDGIPSLVGVVGTRSIVSCQAMAGLFAETARPASGAAAGDLAGTYPNPTIKPSVGLTTPNIGAATGTSFTATGAITSSGGGIGYASGAGGTVTQLTSKSTGVTINKLSGTITMHNAALAAGAIVSFTITNSTVAATDVVVVQHDTIGTIGGYTVMPNTSAGGSFRISIRNNTAGSLSEAIVLRFAIFKAVVA